MIDPNSPDFLAWRNNLRTQAGYAPVDNSVAQAAQIGMAPDDSVAQAARMADPNYGNMMQSSGAAQAPPMPMMNTAYGNATQSGGMAPTSELQSAPQAPGSSIFDLAKRGLAALPQHQQGQQPAAPELDAAVHGGTPMASTGSLYRNPIVSLWHR